MANIIMFGILAAVIVLAALYCVATKYIMRSATALLFVLFGVAGMYFVLDYTFLGAVQLSIYAGAITMIYVFAIQVVGRRALQGLKEKLTGGRVGMGILVGLIGLVTIVAILLKNRFLYCGELLPDKEIKMQTIGTALMGAGKYQYILPFEFISIFLLACIIGGLVIARSRKEEERKEL
ncbi:MAG: NADH-quinone oxidoreductase subunit J [Prevotella sp.]|nr:NADH-quinone oxidoreductase subunit J [Prevotella sp.]